MIKIELYKKFIIKYVKKYPGNILPSNKLHTFFCSVYNINPKDFDIRVFIPKFKQTLNEQEPTFTIFNKKVRLEENDGRPLNCLIGIDLNYAPLKRKIKYVKERLIEQQNTPSPLIESTPNHIKKVSNKTMEPIKEQVNVTVLTLEDFVKTLESGAKEKINIIPTNVLYKQYEDFSTEEKKIPDNQFTGKFNALWKIIHPNTPLALNLRDPNDRKKRALGYIQKKT